jgi:hypothetical protein
MKTEIPIERLIRVYAAAGLPPIQPAKDTKSLKAIAAAIHPLRLPRDLETFWRRVDADSIASVGQGLTPGGPAAALAMLPLYREETWGVKTPQVLFPVGYGSHTYFLVELDDQRGNGGPCFEWGAGSEGICMRYASISAYLDLLATMVELGEHEAEGVVPYAQWAGAAQVRLATAAPLGVYGHQTIIGEDPRSWPAHWRAAGGVAADDYEPRGATTTAAQLLSRAAGGVEASGTIRGRVVSAAMTGDGRRVAVDDGSAVLDIWCPTDVCTYGPVMHREFEFDLIVRPDPPAPIDTRSEHREAQRRALSGDMSGAQDAIRRLSEKTFGTPAAARATAVRPLD